jgi:hypothetical protein
VTPPAAATIVQRPELITLLSSAAFTFVLVDASPGVSTFNYTLTLDSGQQVLLPGAPKVSQGTPSSVDPSHRTATLGLTGLSTDLRYTLKVWSLDQVRVPALAVVTGGTWR